MSAFLIPLTNAPQTFEIALGGTSYLMTCRWNDAEEAGWVIDLTDVDSNVPIIANLPLVTGVDLLEGLEYLGFEGELWMYTEGDTFAVPTLDTLGTDSNLYFVTDVAA